MALPDAYGYVSTVADGANIVLVGMTEQALSGEHG